ncbi:MAG: hypothetical protein DELT_00709 [Desulfovibrio sp.]
MRAVHRVFLAAGYYSLVLLWTGILGVISPVMYCWFRWARVMEEGRAVREIVWYYGRGWAKIFTTLTPTVFAGTERDVPLPCIFVANHQSFFDAYFMGALCFPNVVFIVRSWPFRIPFYGFFMRKAGYIDAETLNAADLVAAGKKALQSGASIVVFPEGTRSYTREMGRFRSGAFVLALQTGVPIVPICLDGTGDFLRRGDFLPRPAKVRVTILAPLYPEEYAPLGEGAHRQLRRDTKERLRNALERSAPGG